jgi:tetratricopeptide (TPR) repeat protein
MLREALQAKIRIFGEFHRAAELTRHNLARVLTVTGAWTEAEQLDRSLLQRKLQRAETDRLDVAASQAGLARVLLNRGMYEESIPLWIAAREAVVEQLGATGRLYALTSLGLGRALSGSGRFSEAGDALRVAYAAHRALSRNEGAGAARSLAELVRVDLARAADSIDCEPLFESLSAAASSPIEHAYVEVTLGACWRANGDRERGNAAIDSGVSVLRAKQSDQWPERRWAESLTVAPSPDRAGLTH